MKFRIYNTNLKKFVTDQYEWYITLDGRAVYYDFEISDAPDCIVSRFTRIKDKYGVEIFEGDIVRDEFRDYKVDYKGWPGFVMFVSPEMVLDASQLAGDECEVVGNIYEL